MRFPLLVSLLAAALSCCSFLDAAAAHQQRSLYIVYNGETLEPSPELTQASHYSLLSSVLPSEEIALQSHVLSYKKSFNGFAAMLTSDEASAMSDMPGVASVFRSKQLQLHTTRSWNYMGFPLSKSQTNLELEGDVIIGVLDTGVWPESESYSDDLLGPIPTKWRGVCEEGEEFNASNCNRKLIGARLLTKAAEAEYSEISIRDFKSPRDSFGHGTYVSSVAAGSVVKGANMFGLAAGDSRGGAPGARIAMYKVIWKDHGTEADVLAAFDDAIHDGVDILSLSIGFFSAHLFSDGIAIGSFHAMKKGIFVSCAGGNSGPVRGSVKNVAPWVITVAASSIDRDFIAPLVLGNNVTLKGRAINSQVPEGHYPLISGADAAPDDFGRFCNTSLDSKKVKGKIVICNHIIGSNVETNVLSAGGVGMVMIDEKYKDVAFIYGLPTSSIGTEDADTTMKYLNSSSSPIAEIISTFTTFHHSSPRVASFSSRGPNPIIFEVFKPDVTAPGLNILSSWSPFQNITREPQDHRHVSFIIGSGTSCSCPHVTGAAAFVKAQKPDWSPAAIKSALMTTAMPLDTSYSENKDGEFAYGSGHIDPVKAIDPGLIYDISPEEYAEYLCYLGYNETVMRVITGNDTTCSTTLNTTIDLNYPAISIPVHAGTEKVWRNFTRKFTNVGELGMKAKYKLVKVKTTKGLKLHVHPKMLTFTGAALETKTYTIQVQAHLLNTTVGNISRKMAFLSGSIVWSDGVHEVRTPIMAWAAPTQPYP